MAAIRLINEKAFGAPNEANVVDHLRGSCSDLLSLVAVMDGRLVGHILFSPVPIESGGRVVHGMGLAPLAVLPEFQRQGIGSGLIQEGLRILRSASCPFVIVVGHPGYYPRFGFEPASRHGIRSHWEGIPSEAFMVLVLDEPFMRDISGIASYRKEFDEAM